MGRGRTQGAGAGAHAIRKGFRPVWDGLPDHVHHVHPWALLARSSYAGLLLSCNLGIQNVSAWEVQQNSLRGDMNLESHDIVDEQNPAN